MIFGNWDAGAESLAAFLGDLRWYLDVMIERQVGGLEFVPGIQRHSLDAALQHRLEQFLHREVRLLSELRLEEWLELFTDVAKTDFARMATRGASPSAKLSSIRR